MKRWKNKKLEKGQISKKLIRDTSTYVILMLALVAMTFFGVCTPNSSNFSLLPQSGNPATVAGVEVSVAEFKSQYRNYQSYFQRIYGGNFDPAAMNLSKMVLDSLVGQKVSDQLAQEMAISVGNDVIVEELVSNYKDDKGKYDSANFKQYLRQSGLSEKEVFESVAATKRNQRFRDLFGSAPFIASGIQNLQSTFDNYKVELEYVRINPNDVKVSVTKNDIAAFLKGEDTAKEVDTYFSENEDEFNTPKKVKARHLLVSFEGARRVTGDAAKRKKEDARKKIDGLLSKLKSASEKDFIAIVKANTDEASGKSSGGDLGTFKKEDMVPEFSKAAFAMKKGQTSAVVESPFGFHVIRVLGIENAKSTPLDKAKRTIATKLIKKKRQPEIAEKRLNEALALGSSSSKLNAKVKSFGWKWEKTGLFALKSGQVPKLGGDKAFVEAMAELNKVGDVFTKPVKVQNFHYILKLAKIENKPANIEKDTVGGGQLAQSWGQKLTTAWQAQYKKNLENQDRLYINPDFENLSQKSARQRNGG